MARIDSSYVFSTPEVIFLPDLLKLSMRSHTHQKVLVPFYDEEVKEHGQNYLIFLNLVNETPKTRKGDRGKYSK